MKLFFSCFFLVIMTLNVALPLVERLHGRDMYEWTEASSDDTDEESKSEKEKEKESISSSCYHDVNLDASVLKKFKKSLFSTDDLPLSELFASLPELPPEL